MKKPGLILLAVNLFVALVLLLLANYFHSFSFTFSIAYILLFIPTSYLAYRALLEGIPLSLKNLKRDFLILAALSLALYLATLLFSSVTLGSVYLTLLIAIASGFFAFTLLKHKEPHAGEEKKPLKNPYRYLLAIFLLAFALRALVFGTPNIPLGYDTPGYLTIALEGSKLSFQKMLANTFKISSNIYLDTWDFSYVWLGLSYKILALFGLEPEYVAKLVMPLISALSTLPLFLLARELTGNSRTALFSAFVFALMPSELVFSFLYKEIMGEFFLILSLFLIVKFLKNSSYTTIFLLLISLFFLWKSAITAFAKFILFALPITAYYLQGRKLSKNKRPLILFALGLLAFILLKGKMITTFPLSPTYVAETLFPSQRFSFGLISLIDLIPLALSALYFARIYSSEKKSRAEKSTSHVALAIFFALFFYSFVIAGIGGYRIFPSSNFLNTLRFSLYLGIPFSLLAGLFLNTLSQQHLRRSRAIIAFILSTLLLSFALTGSTNTTPTPGHIGPSISEELYQTMNTLDYSGYDGVVALGEGFSLRKWTTYLVLKNSGRKPILIGKKESLENLPLENKSYLFLNLTNKRVNDIRALKEP